MGDCTERVVLCIFRGSLKPLGFGKSVIYRYIDDMFLFDRRIVTKIPNQYRPSPWKPANEPKDGDNERDILITEEDTVHLVRLVRQTVILPSSRDSSSVMADARGQVQKVSLLERCSTQAWTTALCIIDEFPKRAASVRVLNPANASPSFAKQQQISTAFPIFSANICSKYD